MKNTEEARVELGNKRKLRFSRILDICHGKTRAQIADEMLKVDESYYRDLILNDICILKRMGKVKSESIGGRTYYFRATTYDVDDTLAESPVAMWFGYGAKKVKRIGREYEMDNFDHREYTVRKTQVYISGNSLETII